MLTARKTAREVLPLVVIAWATLVILGGALEAVEGSGLSGDGAATGLGLCALSVAVVFGTGLVKRLRPGPATFVAEPRKRVPDLLALRRPAAYSIPPPGPPPLRLSQVLRT